MLSHTDVDNSQGKRDVPAQIPPRRWVEGLKEFAAVIAFLAFVLCLIVLGGME